jgi:hypothetical protein
MKNFGPDIKFEGEDSRLRTPGKGYVRTPMGDSSLVWCASCHDPKKRGIVPTDVTHVTYYCTECVLKYGTPLDSNGKPSQMVPGTEGM